MNPVTEDIKDRLVSGGFGVFADTTGNVFGIFISNEPEQPDTSITLYDTGGPPPGFFIDKKKPVFTDTFQVRVRSLTYLASSKKLIDINNFLAQIISFKVTGVDSGELDVRYLGITQTTHPLPLEKDNQDRHIWVASFQAFRQEVV